MKFGVLALDYDGTIARDGVLEPAVHAAILEARARGVVVVIVTGRILRELRRAAGDLDFVDAVVAENGAVLSFPSSGRAAVLGPPPPPAFLEELGRRGIPYTPGECVVEADAYHAHGILDVIRALELPLALLYNRGRVMVLPQSISKATGLREALASLRLSLHNTIAIGDAENDHELLAACEIGLAVSWGSAALMAAADEVLEGDGPQAVAEYIRRVAIQPRLTPEHSGRRRVLLGYTLDGQPLSLAVRGRNILVAGDPRSGKSWVSGLLCEQMILRRYCMCIIDPEGDYRPLVALPGVQVLGGDREPPRPHDLARALRHPDVSLVVDLSQVGHRDRVSYLRALLPALAALRRRTGLPHRIVVDEAHYFLNGQETGKLLDLELHGYTLITCRPSTLHPEVLAATEAILVTHTTEEAEIQALTRICGGGRCGADCRGMLRDLESGEAVVLGGFDESGCLAKRIRLAPRLTSHVRHRAKYLDVPVPESQAFTFASDRGGPAGPRARTLKEFARAMLRSPAEVLEDHMRRGDFSRWIAGVFGDMQLAAQIRRLEERHRMDHILDLNEALVQLIRERYEVGDGR
jgi:hypothetical protein